MPYYYGFDWTYIVLVLPCVILSLWASANVNSTFKRYSQQYSRRGLTGAQAAAQVLSANGVSGVRIERISGNLTDHYDPRTNVIRLSDDVYGSTSTAAIGVACHEAGHAVQYAQDYTPIRIRAAVIPATNLGSTLAMPLILIGLLITMGIGTSFGTIPVIALLYVPMCQRLGISLGATTCLIACAAALGDAGSPASDSTLGPTAGLNADGQHDHIWDTCVPTFIFYNIPLVVAGFIGCMIL